MHVVHVSRRLADWRRIGDRFEAEVRAVEEEVRRMGGVFHRHVRWSGAAWPAIVAAAREVDADLVVLRPRDAGDDGAGRTWAAVTAQARTNVLLLPAAPPAPSAPGADVRETGEARGGPAEGSDPADVELEAVPA